MIGRQVSHFYIVGKIGGGGMGDVYEAQDTRLPRAVAVKFLKPARARDPVAVKRFMREARLASSLNHPGICTVIDIDEVDGEPFITMELLDGRSLRDRLADGPVPVVEALDIAVRVCDALASAHEEDIVHRDITPGNIFLTTRGDVKLLDFGLAKYVVSTAADADVTEGLTDAGTVAGTVHYASPEHLRGEQRVDGRSDLFSLGVVLYQMVTGTRPFDGRAKTDVIKAVFGATPVPPRELARDLPVAFDRVVGRLLEKHPAARYETASDLLTELTTLRASLQETAPVDVEAPAPVAAVAVLPFRVVGADDAAAAAFADGVIETIAWRLQQMSGISVASRTSTRACSDLPVHEVAERLSVGVVVEGSVQMAGETARVIATIVSARTGHPLAPAARLDVSLGDPLAAQDEVARTIASRAQTSLAGTRFGPGTRSRDAHTEFRKSRHHRRHQFSGGWPAALEHAERAIELDPEFALAHVGVASIYTFLGFFSIMPPRLAFDKALRAADRALELDPDLAPAHDARARVLFGGKWDWEGAEDEFRHALRIDPDQPAIRVHYSLLLSVLGRDAAAMAEARKALGISKSRTVVSGAANTCAMVGRFDEAIELCNECLRVDPDHVFARYVRGQCYHVTGMADAACRDLERAANLGQRTPFYLGFLGKACAESERRDQALAIVRELDERAATEYVPPHVYVFIHAGLGNPEQAMAFQEQAYRDGAPPTNYLNPCIRGLFSRDPGHKDRLQQMRLSV